MYIKIQIVLLLGSELQKTDLKIIVNSTGFFYKLITNTLYIFNYHRFIYDAICSNSSPFKVFMQFAFNIMTNCDELKKL